NEAEPVFGEEEKVTLTDELIISRIDPIIKKIIYDRLKGWLHTTPKTLLSAEAEDIYQTIVMRLFGNNWIRNVSSQNNNIGDVKRYAATIAHNVCNDFFRERYPERNRLKAKVCDLLRRHPKFAYWKLEDQTLCGFSRWTGCGQSKRVEELIREIN